jgi:hypothetical protein
VDDSHQIHPTHSGLRGDDRKLLQNLRDLAIGDFPKVMAPTQAKFRTQALWKRCRDVSLATREAFFNLPSSN